MIFSRSTHINDPPLVIKSSLTPCPNFWDHLFMVFACLHLIDLDLRSTLHGDYGMMR
jgi:hypothetical protein